MRRTRRESDETAGMTNDERLLVEAGWERGSVRTVSGKTVNGWVYRSDDCGSFVIWSTLEALTHPITTVRLHELANSGEMGSDHYKGGGEWGVSIFTDANRHPDDWISGDGKGATYNEALRAAYTAYKIAVGEWEDE